MEFTSYKLISGNTSSLNTGSYLNGTEYSLFVNDYVNDLWYAYSVNDAIEFSVWDRNKSLIGWTTLTQSKTYNNIELTYTNAIDSQISYSYKEFRSDFILYENTKILVNPIEDISTFKIVSGSYILTYNFIREMAGNFHDPLVIKDISPSRKELKLVPISASNPTYETFCKQKVLIGDISSLYLKSTKECPYGQIYNKISPLYLNQINTIKSLFFINGDGSMLTFFKNLYEDLYIYTTLLRNSSFSVESINQNLIRIQGIQTYFNNYLFSNTDTIVNFTDLDNNFNGFVSASIERKFSSIGKYPSQEYVDAKIFVYDFFTKYFYTPITTLLSSTYNGKYFSHLKNSLNVGNNRLLPIINIGMMDERVSPSDPLTLLIKLKTELPNDLSMQTNCWITNTSFSPYVVNIILKNPMEKLVHSIGFPNFSIPISNASLSNTNLSYTADDFKNSDETDRELTVSRNINELVVDYTQFENFVVFSSAELRLKIFKNKTITMSSLSSSLQLLTQRNITFLAASGSAYPYYTYEHSNIQGQITNLINSFDGYESYLYRSGNYDYRNGTFISSSYVVELDSSSSYYDKNNRDSLINNCPEHILIDSENDEYIIFLSMIGHFFDNIFIYINNMQSERKIGNNATEEFTRRVVDYMLETFGWNLDNSLDQSNLVDNYLTSNQLDDLNSMSSEDRLKVLRNRLFINLPQIYKTKGTEESIRLILSCYGIPSSLLSIREFGGVNYSDNRSSYTTYERVYMRQWDTSSVYDTYYLNTPGDCRTFLFKCSIDDSTPYSYGSEQILYGKINANSAQSISGSGDWAVGFERVARKNTGKIFFRIGYKGYETFKMYSPEFQLFDGNIYSIMLRRNMPNEGFEYTSNIDSVPSVYDLYIQRNEFGNKIIQVTSSQICYNSASNIMFGNSGKMNLVGWFSWNNGQGYTGTFDKFQIWHDSITDSNFEDYTNNINAYSFNSPDIIGHQSLIYRMHTDYPVDQRQYPPGSPSIMGVTANNWLGIWRNGNPYYAVSSSNTLENIYGTGVEIDYAVCWGAWSGSLKLVYDSGSCKYISQSTYPFQYKVIDYPSTWGISKYGPNKFRNEKVRYISQSIEARFDDKERSTYVPIGNTAPDSNQVGFFIDPQDFKNKDIVRYYGNFDFMDTIGSPDNQFSESYSSLRTYRKRYSDSLNQYSGSKTLFNELCILYKLYFNRSVFEAIKNVIPARTNTIVGVVIEPTILERPKYQAKKVFSEANTNSVYYYDNIASHYFKDDDIKLVKVYPEVYLENTTMSTDWSPTSTIYLSSSNPYIREFPVHTTTSINVSYINLPNENYPVNYGGNYIGDSPDIYEVGHFAGGILTDEELDSLYFAPELLIIATPTGGVLTNGKLTVNFNAKHLSIISYSWMFGDETPLHDLTNQSNLTSPGYSHTYNHAGIYTVNLTGHSIYNNKILALPIFITVLNSLSAAFTEDPSSGVVPLTVIFTNTSTGATRYKWYFGDGETSTEVNPVYTYAYSDVFIVTLIAYSDGGESDTAINTVSINDNGKSDTAINTVDTIIYPIADFIETVRSSTVWRTWDFVNTSLNATHYVWNFGDGTDNVMDETTNTQEHTYTVKGAYSVTLTALDNVGNSNIKVKIVHVLEPVITIPCGGITEYDGGIGWPNKDQIIKLGTGTGKVLLTYQTYGNPDKIEIWIDNQKVLDTGYRGNINDPINYQRLLTSFLQARGLSSEQIVGSGRGSMIFEKTSTYPNAVVRIWSPLQGTAWRYILNCPSTTVPCDALVELDGNPNTRGIEYRGISGRSTVNSPLFEEYTVSLGSEVGMVTFIYTITNSILTGFFPTTFDIFIDNVLQKSVSVISSGRVLFEKISISPIVTIRVSARFGQVWKFQFTCPIPVTIEPDFISNMLIGNAPFTTTFINQSLNATYYLWNFGDNTKLVQTTNLNPIDHKYIKIGTYTVILTAYNSTGGSRLKTRTDYITVNSI